MSLAATWITRDVEVHVQAASAGRVDLGTFRVRPAGVREGVSVLECYTDALRGDEDAWRVVAATVRAWLPLRLSSVLLARCSRENVVRLAVALISEGVPASSRNEHKEKQEQVEKEAQRVGWGSLLARYRRQGGSLDDPFALFVEQTSRYDELQAHEELSFMRAYAAVRSEKDAGRNAILRRAGLAEDLQKMSKEEKEKKAQEGLARLADIYRMNQRNPMA